MKTAILFAALLTVSAPALAQEAGDPGATGVGGSLTGSNPGSGYYRNDYYRRDYAPGPYVVEGPGSYDGPGVYVGPGPFYGPGPYYGPRPFEGRAAAPNDDPIYSPR